MVRVLGAGVYELFYVAAVTDATAPSVAELNAGIDLTGFLIDGTLDTPLEGSIVDESDVSSDFNKTGPGTYGGDALAAEFYRDNTTDTAWTTLARAVRGYMAITRFGRAGTAWASGDTLELWPITVISRNMMVPARNEKQRFRVMCAVPGIPLEDYTLA